MVPKDWATLAVPLASDFKVKKPLLVKTALLLSVMVPAFAPAQIFKALQIVAVALLFKVKFLSVLAAEVKLIVSALALIIKLAFKLLEKVPVPFTSPLMVKL